MNPIREPLHAGQFVITSQGTISLDTVSVVADAALPAGMVLGLKSDGTYHVYDNAASDGTQAAAAILFAPITEAGTFNAVVVSRLAEVDSKRLSWKSGASDSDKSAGVADLKSKFVIVR